MPTKGEQKAAEEVLRAPSAKDLDLVRARRIEVKDILNSNLLSPEARKSYELLYEETGRILTEAASKAGS